MSRFSRLEFEGPQKPEEAKQVREHKPEAKAPDKAHFLRLGWEKYLEGEFEAALRYYGRSLEYDRATVEAWVGQVQALIALGEFKEARLWANKALGFFRDNADLLAAKAVAAARSGALQEAAKLSDSSLVGDVKSPYPWLARSEVLVARKAGNEEWCFDKALLYAADRAWAFLVMAQADMYYGRHAKAAEYLKKALGQTPGNFYLWLLLGDCYHALGLEASAEECYRKTLELNPGCREARLRVLRWRHRGIGAAAAPFLRRLRHLFGR